MAAASPWSRRWQLSPDGSRFLVLIPSSGAEPPILMS
jgi:hypothetical protein